MDPSKKIKNLDLRWRLKSRIGVEGRRECLFSLTHPHITRTVVQWLSGRKVAGSIPRTSLFWPYGGCGLPRGGRLQVQFRALPCVGHLAVVASHEVDGLTKDSLTPLKESLAGKNNNNREGITVSCLVIRIFSLIQISDTICRFGA